MAAAFAASPPDVVLGYGSGAAIDSAKLLREQAVRHASTAEDLVSAVAQDHGLEGSRPVLVAVPTTLSGAAFTGSAGVTVHGSGDASRKLVAKGPGLAADAAMLDPGLCTAAPSDVWVSTGFKAVEHAVESIYSPAANVVTTTLCGQGLRLLAQSLQVSDTRTSDQALDCLLASWLVLLGRGNITFGPSHAIGHQLGGVLGVRHGLTAAAVLPSVMRFTEQHVAAQQRAAVDAAGLAAGPGMAERRPWEAIQAWAQRLGLPASVRELAVDPGELKALAPAVAADMSRESGTAWLDRIGGVDGVARLLEDVW
jgi:alcohol dehydrogenase